MNLKKYALEFYSSASRSGGRRLVSAPPLLNARNVTARSIHTGTARALVRMKTARSGVSPKVRNRPRAAMVNRVRALSVMVSFCFMTFGFYGFGTKRAAEPHGGTAEKLKFSNTISLALGWPLPFHARYYIRSSLYRYSEDALKHIRWSLAR